MFYFGCPKNLIKRDSYYESCMVHTVYDDVKCINSGTVLHLRDGVLPEVAEVGEAGVDWQAPQQVDPRALHAQPLLCGVSWEYLTLSLQEKNIIKS